MERGKIVIIEGTSCVGKTTICNKLSETCEWVIIPEAIRYLELETNKIGDEASPIPNEQQEEEFFQRELFRIETQRIKEANELANSGKNVLMDKSFIATIATAFAFEKIKGFSGTFKKSLELYYNDLTNFLINRNLVYYDQIFLLTAENDIILQRNKTRNHILEDIWINPELLRFQREFLENFVLKECNSSTVIDTSYKNENIVEQEIKYYINNIKMEGQRRK